MAALIPPQKGNLPREALFSLERPGRNGVPRGPSRLAITADWRCFAWLCCCCNLRQNARAAIDLGFADKLRRSRSVWEDPP